MTSPQLSLFPAGTDDLPAALAASQLAANVVLSSASETAGVLSRRLNLLQEDSMRFSKLFIIGVAFVSMLGSSAYAQDKAAQRAEVKAKAMQALQDFYKADPKLKGVVEAAP